MKADWKVGDKFWMEGCCGDWHTIIKVIKGYDLVIYDHVPPAICNFNKMFESEEDMLKNKVHALNIKMEGIITEKGEYEKRLKKCSME